MTLRVAERFASSSFSDRQRLPNRSFAPRGRDAAVASRRLYGFPIVVLPDAGVAAVAFRSFFRSVEEWTWR
jgi:hypothetical protein